MMRRNTIFDYLTQLMVIWGISMLSLCLFCTLFGETDRGYSSIFQLGSAGISVATALQFFCLAAFITALKWIFFSDILIKGLSVLFRSILMFASITVLVGIFAAVFQWFPVNQAKPWILFFICFFLCSFVSVIISVIKEKSDNRKIQEALEHLKETEMDYRKKETHLKQGDTDLMAEEAYFMNEKKFNTGGYQ